ncbi:ATP-dependent zinc protease [Granulosicoccus antarcticus]|uniref:Retropepsin-like aspartic endopeptidase domain-containing protein n=1 Tax=Granulosicoccus antarcticus IMCC3135 TaxID=1192854 RepID=A0A2Z2NW48_9GAMM|nr:ATP-dependent zinc protease [Granulosicoccus antarcticus]ASJ74735.1 hypothetical protein IMCC3135_23330 [Granulosicoccus antarcticus IMCC3135]
MVASNNSVDSNTADNADSSSLVVGWREWVGLPQLGLPAIKAKVDTGARTSAIHARDIERVTRDGQDWILFTVQPIQRDTSIVRRCEAPLVDIRRVTDSGGHSAERYFISTVLTMGPVTRTIEMTLSQRDDMLFRMLLGRTALVPNIQVNPASSFSLGRVSARALYAEDIKGSA